MQSLGVKVFVQRLVVVMALTYITELSMLLGM